MIQKGREQARIAGKWIRENIGDIFDRYYASEFVRAQETAAYLGLPDAKWYCDFFLGERSLGYMDNTSYEEREEKFPDAMRFRKIDPFFWPPPSGESIADVCLRIVATSFNTLARECDMKDVIIVNHGEVMWAYRVRLERMSKKRYLSLNDSKHPFDKIHNCQILHYTRENPKTGDIAPYLNWMRSVCPTDLSLSRNIWEEIERPVYTNEDLLTIVNEYPQLFE